MHLLAGVELCRCQAADLASPLEADQNQSPM